MKKICKRAFTLIELLVVIAIIAILAAILFPVFAQAKRAAKGAVAISGAKQIALAQLMYTNDFDDAFAPVCEFDSNWGVLPFEYSAQPYMKSWALLLDPTGPVNIDQVLDDETGGQDFEIYGLWGMPPERTSTISTSPTDFTMGNLPMGQIFTGGRLYYYDGIGGVSTPPGGCQSSSYDNFACWGYVAGNNPSLTTTAIANPADQVMVAQSGEWDFMWEMVGLSNFGNGNDTPDNFDVMWSTCDNTYQCDAVICGPIARQRDNDGASVGFFPAYTSGGTNANTAAWAVQPLPTGLTAWAGTDGHAKSTPWRKLMGTTIPISGGNLAIKAFWPTGS
jgi:prepilin-type N-terminal cleavage/methylation domain-containing protein